MRRQIDHDHPLATAFRGQSVERAGVSGDPWGLQAATDVREFVARDIPAIVWGPGSLDQAHTTDEWIDLEEAALGLDLLKACVRDVLAAGRV
ncbi:hypothetical protein BRD09_00015 [Halobacteriales archaeon SW_10_68_16]|nr:MAG: hypothetical protein BRD09_00015 [Halobacteriales archaeon SW_10_68_16]